MVKIKKLAMVAVLAAFVSLQSGCIVGLSIGNPGLAWGGLGLWSLGFIADSPLAKVAGIVLDASNTGRQDALNPWPVDNEVAATLGTTVDTLLTYNDELNQVIAADDYISSIVESLSQDYSLTSDEATMAAKTLGLTDGQELVDVLKGDSLSQSNVQKFATAFKMSPSTAELYLKRRWNVKVDK